MNILDLAIFVYILISFGVYYALWYKHNKEKISHRIILSIFWPIIIGIIIINMIDYLEQESKKENKSCQ